MYPKPISTVLLFGFPVLAIILLVAMVGGYAVAARRLALAGHIVLWRRLASTGAIE